MTIPFEKFKVRLLTDPKVKAEYDALAPEFEIAPQPSCPAKAGHPVRCGLSVQSRMSLEYWITRMRG